jgi:hypothetical protein
VRFLLLALASLSARADSITVEITPERHAIVHEHFSIAGPVEFVFLRSDCMQILVDESGTGPWFPVSIPKPDAISYEARPATQFPGSCALPLLMPKHPIRSVSITVIDHGGLTDVTVPCLARDRGSKSWSGTFPAVPSQIGLEWRGGDTAIAENRAPTGAFFWNFWGLATVLVTWIAAYLTWARRETH